MATRATSSQTRAMPPRDPWNVCAATVSAGDRRIVGRSNGFKAFSTALSDLSDATLTSHQYVAKHKQIHIRAKEAVKRLFRLTDHRLVLVEGRIEHHWNSRKPLKGRYEAMIQRVGSTANCLQ